MEQYKEKIKVQNGFAMICCLVLAVFAVLAIGTELGWFNILSPAADDLHQKSTWYGYIAGISCSTFAVMAVLLIRNCRALKDEKKLKALYVKEHDERTIQIQVLARSTAMQCLLWLGLVGTAVAGYFNFTVSITILCCTFVSSSVSLFLMNYYSKKF